MTVGHDVDVALTKAEQRKAADLVQQVLDLVDDGHLAADGPAAVRSYGTLMAGCSHFEPWLATPRRRSIPEPPVLATRHVGPLAWGTANIHGRLTAVRSWAGIHRLRVEVESTWMWGRLLIVSGCAGEEGDAAHAIICQAV